MALATLGTEDYQRLWSGELSFTDPAVVGVWETFGEVLDCTNDDAAGLSWQQAIDRVANGEAAFNVMGDWAAGYMNTTLGLEAGEGFGWAAAPGTEGVFMLLSDSFGLPVGAPNPDSATAWLELVGSREGQDVFNPLKGSISPRLDSDINLYSAYSQSAAQDYQENPHVGSLVHGAVANETFMSEFANVLESYLSSRSAESAANAAAELAAQTGVGN